jgi:thioester reductase-like protein
LSSVGSLLITGSTGMLGRQVTRQLLAGTDRHLTLLLHRQRAGMTKERLLRETFGVRPSSAVLRRVRIVRGDVTKPRLGLSQAEASRLAAGVDGLLHAAGSTRFDLPLPLARQINVDGTRQVVRFAERCPRLARFGLVSTAFVSGRRQGTILESERRHGTGFVNSYEQSKYEAEECVETSALPYAIYRLSTLVGDSRTGATTHFTTPHQSLRVMYLGLASLVPGRAHCPVDLIPTDWAAQTLIELFLQRFEKRRVHHLAAGAPASYTLAEVIDDSYRWLATVDPDWGQRGYPKPAIGSQSAFRLLVDSARRAQDTIMMGVLGALQHFTEQFSYPKAFDTSSLNGSPRPPDIRSYYGRVVAYCLSSRWGRRG